MARMSVLVPRTRYRILQLRYLTPASIEFAATGCYSGRAAAKIRRATGLPQSAFIRSW